MGRPVCLLKDQTLRTLHADLMGKLYRPFDTQNPATIGPPLVQWLRDWGIVNPNPPADQIAAFLHSSVGVVTSNRQRFIKWLTAAQTAAEARSALRKVASGMESQSGDPFPNLAEMLREAAGDNKDDAEILAF